MEATCKKCGLPIKNMRDGEDKKWYHLDTKASRIGKDGKLFFHFAEPKEG